MRILGRDKIDEFVRTHSEIRSKVLSWLRDVENAQFKSHHDIKALFSKASIIGKAENIVIFNIGRNYRLEAKVNYDIGVVTVNRIDVHSKYDKWTY